MPRGLSEVGQSQPAPNCLVGVLMFFASTHASVMLAMLPGPWLTDWATEYPWLAVLFFPWLLTVWIGGTMLGMRLMGRLWEQGQRGLVGLLLVACWGIAGCGLWVMMTQMPNDYRFNETLGPHAKEYWELKGEGRGDDLPVIRGKCVLVTSRGGIDSYSQSQLPRSIRAETPEDVRTVVQFHHGKEPVKGTEDGQIDTCQVVLIDRHTGELLGKKFFKGTWRQVQVKGKGLVWVGSLDSTEITHWLRDLPREP